MNSKSNQKSPFRDTIRERNAVKRAQTNLAEFEDEGRERAAIADVEAGSPNFHERDWAAWTGKLSATVEDLLAVVANLQAVADHAEGDAR